MGLALFTACLGWGLRTSTRADDPPCIYLAAGSSTSVWFPICTAVSEALSPVIPATAEVTGGGLENCIRVGNGDMGFGVVNANAAFQGANGLWPFDRPYDISAVANLYLCTVQIVVWADSDIDTIADLKGKKVVLGQAGSSLAMAARQLLQEYGIAPEDLRGVEMSYQEGAMAMRDGNCDAMIVIMPAPNSSIVDLTLAHPIRLLNLDKAEEIAKKYSYFSATRFTPSAYYSNLEAGEIHSLELGSTLIVWNHVPEGQVYAMLCAIFNNLDTIGGVHATAKQITLQGARQVPIPLHPEAQKFYAERDG